MYVYICVCFTCFTLEYSHMLGYVFGLKSYTCACVRVGAGACSQGRWAHAGLRVEPAQQDRPGPEGSQLMYVAVFGWSPGSCTGVLQVSADVLYFPSGFWSYIGSSSNCRLGSQQPKTEEVNICYLSARLYKHTLHLNIVMK